MSLSVVMITRNEECNVRACLESVSWADEMIVVDSGSVDRTVEIAKQLTPHVYFNDFENFAKQKNYALEKAKQDWILVLDADERVTPELAAEIKSVINNKAPQAVYALHRSTKMFGHTFRFCGTQNDFPIRLFPRGKARYVQAVHEWIESDLPAKRLRSDLLHFGTRDLAHHIQKMRNYLALEMEVMRAKQKRVIWLDFTIRPLAKFVMLYVLQLGVLDGLAGLKFSALSAYYDFEKYRSYWKNK